MNNQPAKRELKKFLGPAFGLAVMVGGTIGVGILRTPGPIAALVQNGWLMIAVWIIGGIYVLIAAGSLAELATMLPKAGGGFNYVKRAFGNYAGFVTGWFDYILNAISPAYFSIAISEYLVLLFPRLHGNETVIALAVLVAFTFLHLAGIKSGSMAQQVTSVLKLLALVTLVVCCFLWKGDAPHAATTAPALNYTLTGGLFIGLLRSMLLVLGAYNGWGVPVFFAEEDTNPGKHIPRSLFAGAIIVMVVYVLINAALLYVLPVQTMAGSKLAAADAAAIVFGNTGATVITLIALFSLLSILNAYMMVNPRILFGLSREGFFIPQGAAINKGGTPATALIITSVLGVVMILTGSFERLFALGAFMSMVVNSLLFASVFKLRQSAPALPRPYRAWGYPFTTLFMLLVSIGFFIGFAYSDPQNFIAILIITGLIWVFFKFVIQPRLNAKV